MQLVNFLIPLRTNIIIVFLLVSLDSFSQDFYNWDNSVRFGKYLYNTNQFDLAIREFERCVFLKPDDRESYLYLFKIHRKTDAFEKAINCFQRFSGNLNVGEMDAAFGLEYFKLLVQNGRYDDAEYFLDKNPFFNESFDFKLSTLLLKKEWKEAYQYKTAYSDYINKSLSDITGKGVILKRKSPAWAGLFSAVVPGSGKAYAGRWKDGLISFVMTSTAAFVSIRGFNKNGNSFYPWVMGGLAFVYYSGGIYGSARAATKYNKDKEDELVKKTSDFILTDN